VLDELNKVRAGAMGRARIKEILLDVGRARPIRSGSSPHRARRADGQAKSSGGSSANSGDTRSWVASIRPKHSRGENNGFLPTVQRANERRSSSRATMNRESTRAADPVGWLEFPFPSWAHAQRRGPGANPYRARTAGPIRFEGIAEVRDFAHCRLGMSAGPSAVDSRADEHRGRLLGRDRLHFAGGGAGRRHPRGRRPIRTRPRQRLSQKKNRCTPHCWRWRRPARPSSCSRANHDSDRRLQAGRTIARTRPRGDSSVVLARPRVTVGSFL